MKAVYITDFGPPSVLQVKEAPLPEPGPGQIRIKVAATTVNFADIQARRNPGPRQPPFIPGLEAAGTIDALGPGARGVEVGQRVAAHSDGGSYAGYFGFPNSSVRSQRSAISTVFAIASGNARNSSCISPGDLK